MAVKTFSAGAVLTAADTNTYLNNGGLVYIKSQTIGTGVSTVTVSDAFSSTYDNYKIVVFGGTANTNQAINLRLGSTTTGYYGNLIYWSYASTTTNVVNQQNTANWGYTGVSTTNGNTMSLSLLGPNLAKRTAIMVDNYVNVTTGGEMGIYGGFLNDATQYTAFTLIVGGTMTGGEIRVYGYRQA